MIDLHSVFVYNIKCKRTRVNFSTVYQQLFFTIYQQLMNYYTSLVKTIDQLNAQGREVKLTKLPSVINIKRKAIKF